MKTENTPENKARFFALYWGQEIQTYRLSRYTTKRKVAISGSSSGFIELAPLSHISDEDTIEVAKIFNLGHLSGAVRKLVISLLESLDKNSQATTMFIRSWIKVVDYLRSRGYYVGDGTEIEYGWVVLKTT